MNNPTDVPHPDSSDWTVLRSGVTRSGGEKTFIFDFAQDENIEARHIALYSATGGIAASELEVYDSVNIAEDRPTYSKTLITYRSSGKAVDVNPFTFYKSVDENNQWWRVKLKDTVYVRLLAIRNEDSERFKDVSILSSTHSTITEDPTPTSSEWTLVMSGISRESDTSSTELTYNFDINNELQTRHIALYSSNSIGLSMREVQIFAYGKWVCIMI
ncbi:hypothetical protein EB796_024217 [Bugula neritina]|uniref:Uncharacterized protein n=1 Tax=Bugula neritina TaxID=10212 RepID=A0A7J7IVA5_BUGNE|nr:hypothetical protein EB796_024217 [Bugula neritina]